MQAEILMIGTELLLGQIVDTNASYMGALLADHGVNLYQKVTVGDNRERIVQALNAALDRSDVVLCSGGLGPTEDDITRECVAEVTGCPLEFQEDLWRHIEELFSRFRFKITENNKRQAYIPKGGTAIFNPNGTAPGIIVEDDRGVIICMPGVPGELKAMLDDSILPYLRDKFDLGQTIQYRVLKVCALGESRVDAAIADLMTTEDDNPKVGLLANPEAVRIRISARAESRAEANALIDTVEAKVRERLPGLIMGVDDETLQGVVDRLLQRQGWTLATVETNTGGLVAQRFTSASARSFLGGTVAPLDLIAEEDPVECAYGMAEKALDIFESSCALSILSDHEGHCTWAAFVTPDGGTDWKFPFTSTDERSQIRTFVVVVEHVRRYLVGLENRA